MIRPLCIALIGPTASGKSEFALQLAKQLDGEIICLDSTTVYQQFNIGTAKPSLLHRKEVPHHLVDVLNPSEPFSAYHFVRLADETIEGILKRNKLPIVVGGTYFYLRALENGMFPNMVIPSDMLESIEREFFEDEELNTNKMHAELKKADPKHAEKVHPNDRYRLLRALAILRSTGQKPSELKPEPLSEGQASRLWLKYAMTVSRHVLNDNIVKRTDAMLAQGLVEETKRLMAEFPGSRALSCIGYNEACNFLNRKLTEKQLRNEIIEKTRQLAKRQLTWLRSDLSVRYVDSRDLDRIQLEVSNLRKVLE